MIPSHSRYSGDCVRVSSVPGRDGSPTKVIEPPHWYGQTFEARKYTVTEGERLEQIAHRFFRDPNMWWVIAVANPEVLYPEEIPGGTEIRIPLANTLR